MEKKIIFNFLCLFIFGIFFALPSSVFAATLGFSPPTLSRAVGSTFSVLVYVSNAGQPMNAASGIVSFPTDKLGVVGISKTNSVMNLWVEEPTFSNTEGKVNFEGIVLNPGYAGNQGTIITITFRTKSAGKASLGFSSGTILANDGTGTNILTSLGTASVSIQTVPVPQDIDTTEVKEPTDDADEISSDTLLEVPVITYYEEEIKFGDVFKVNGIANPGVDVEIRILKNGELIQEKTVQSTGTGSFAIVLDSLYQPGVYTFSARAIDEAGNVSGETSPFVVFVKQKWSDKIMEFILDYLSLTLLLGLALIGAVMGGLFIWYRLLTNFRRIKSKTGDAEKVLQKSFATLQDDIVSHITRLKSVKRKLTAEEVSFLEKFEEELGEAEGVIKKKIQNISNS